MGFGQASWPAPQASASAIVATAAAPTEIPSTVFSRNWRRVTIFVPPSLFDVRMGVGLDLRHHFEHSHHVTRAIRDGREDRDPARLRGHGHPLAGIKHRLHLRNHVLIERAPRPELAHLMGIPDHDADLVRVALNRHPQVDIGGKGCEPREAQQRLLYRNERLAIHVVVVSGQPPVARILLEHESHGARRDDVLTYVAIDHHASDARHLVELRGPIGRRRSGGSERWHEYRRNGAEDAQQSQGFHGASETSCMTYSWTLNQAVGRMTASILVVPVEASSMLEPLHSEGGRSARAGRGFHQLSRVELLKRRAASDFRASSGRRFFRLSRSAKSCKQFRWIFSRMLGIGASTPKRSPG